MNDMGNGFERRGSVQAENFHSEVKGDSQQGIDKGDSLLKPGEQTLKVKMGNGQVVSVVAPTNPLMRMDMASEWIKKIVELKKCLDDRDVAEDAQTLIGVYTGLKNQLLSGDNVGSVEDDQTSDLGESVSSETGSTFTTNSDTQAARIREDFSESDEHVDVEQQPFVPQKSWDSLKNSGTLIDLKKENSSTRDQLANKANRQRIRLGAVERLLADIEVDPKNKKAYDAKHEFDMYIDLISNGNDENGDKQYKYMEDGGKFDRFIKDLKDLARQIEAGKKEYVAEPVSKPLSQTKQVDRVVTSVEQKQEESHDNTANKTESRVVETQVNVVVEDAAKQELSQKVRELFGCNFDEIYDDSSRASSVAGQKMAAADAARVRGIVSGESLEALEIKKELELLEKILKEKSENALRPVKRDILRGKIEPRIKELEGKLNKSSETSTSQSDNRGTFVKQEETADTAVKSDEFSATLTSSTEEQKAKVNDSFTDISKKDTDGSNETNSIRNVNGKGSEITSSGQPVKTLRELAEDVVNRFKKDSSVSKVENLLDEVAVVSATADEKKNREKVMNLMGDLADIESKLSQVETADIQERFKTTRANLDDLYMKCGDKAFNTDYDAVNQEISALKLALSKAIENKKEAKSTVAPTEDTVTADNTLNSPVALSDSGQKETPILSSDPVGNSDDVVEETKKESITSSFNPADEVKVGGSGADKQRAMEQLYARMDRANDFLDSARSELASAEFGTVKLDVDKLLTDLNQLLEKYGFGAGGSDIDSELKNIDDRLREMKSMIDSMAKTTAAKSETRKNKSKPIKAKDSSSMSRNKKTVQLPDNAVKSSLAERATLPTGIEDQLEDKREQADSGVSFKIDGVTETEVNDDTVEVLKLDTENNGRDQNYFTDDQIKKMEEDGVLSLGDISGESSDFEDISHPISNGQESGLSDTENDVNLLDKLLLDEDKELDKLTENGLSKEESTLLRNFDKMLEEADSTESRFDVRPPWEDDPLLEQFLKDDDQLDFIKMVDFEKLEPVSGSVENLSVYLMAAVKTLYTSAPETSAPEELERIMSSTKKIRQIAKYHPEVITRKKLMIIIAAIEERGSLIMFRAKGDQVSEQQLLMNDALRITANELINVATRADVVPSDNSEELLDTDALLDEPLKADSLQSLGSQHSAENYKGLQTLERDERQAKQLSELLNAEAASNDGAPQKMGSSSHLSHSVEDLLEFEQLEKESLEDDQEDNSALDTLFPDNSLMTRTDTGQNQAVDQSALPSSNKGSGLKRPKQVMRDDKSSEGNAVSAVVSNSTRDSKQVRGSMDSVRKPGVVKNKKVANNKGRQGALQSSKNASEGNSRVKEENGVVHFDNKPTTGLSDKDKLEYLKVKNNVVNKVLKEPKTELAKFKARVKNIENKITRKKDSKDLVDLRNKISSLNGLLGTLETRLNQLGSEQGDITSEYAKLSHQQVTGKSNDLFEKKIKSFERRLAGYDEFKRGQYMKIENRFKEADELFRKL